MLWCLLLLPCLFLFLVPGIAKCISISHPLIYSCICNLFPSLCLAIKKSNSGLMASYILVTLAQSQSHFFSIQTFFSRAIFYNPHDSFHFLQHFVATVQMFHSLLSNRQSGRTSWRPLPSSQFWTSAIGVIGVNL